MMLVMACSQDSTNWKLSLDKNSKEPYGCYIAYQNLTDIFTNAVIKSNDNFFTKIKKINQSNSRNKSLVISVTNQFNLSESDLDELMRYIMNGNSALILSNKFSDTLLNYFSLQTKLIDTSSSLKYFMPLSEVTMPIDISFKDSIKSFNYKGIATNHYFDTLINEDFDNTIEWIGRIDKTKRNNLLEYINKGKIIIGHTPTALCNYFLLQQNNKQYYEYLLSHFSKNISEVYWISKLIQMPSLQERSNILNFPPFFKAFLVIVALLLLYTLFEAKRRQRIVENLPPVENASLEFVETVGQLYYNKGDHKNLAEKMILFYLENIRTKHNVTTRELNDALAKVLSHKLNHSEVETKSFISYLNYIRTQPTLVETDIQFLFQQLKKFS
jgi:SUMO ligase MMS21 Smc5/6 complex component